MARTSKNLESSNSKSKFSPQHKETIEESGGGLWEKVEHIAEKSLEAIKTGADKISHVATETTKLSKLKLEIHNIHKQIDKIQTELGKTLWKMQRNNELQNVESAFADEFKKLGDLEKQIEIRLRQVQQISLTN